MTYLILTVLVIMFIREVLAKLQIEDLENQLSIYKPDEPEDIGHKGMH